MADYRLSSAHCHSNLCDGKNTLQDMALAAWKQGMQTLGFTGHSHTPCDLEYCMSPGRTSQYKADITRLKAQYAGKLEILCGLEWDQFSDTDPAGYDYFIGSVHYICGPKTGRYYEIDWREQDLQECMDNEFDGDGLAMAEHYFAQVEKVAEKHPDILGHFDLIKKINGEGKFFDEASPRYQQAALHALEKAFAGCKLLEINTGAVSRGFRKDFYPADFLLTRWHELGGDVIITSDSHSTETLTAYFDEAAEAARKAGFTRVMVLTGHGFEPCEL